MIKDLYGIPREHDAVMSVILGHPKLKYQRTLRRNTLNTHKVTTKNIFGNENNGQ